jgi:RNA polymerase sigma-70 factor, ECF subfamily
MSALKTRSRVTSDSVLVAGISAGDDRALGALYDRYGASLYSLAFAITRHEAAAENAVAATFAQVGREARFYDATRASVQGWVTSLARHHSLEARRKARAPAPRIAGSDVARFDLQAVPASARGSSVPPQPRSAVQTALAELEELERRVLELVYFGGLTLHEVAGQLGISECSAKERLQSAMQALRAALSPRAAIHDEVMVSRV